MDITKLTFELQKQLNLLERKKEQQRRASKRYYEKNFIIKDDMSDEEKQKVLSNKNKINEYYRNKYFEKITQDYEKSKQENLI